MGPVLLLLLIAIFLWGLVGLIRPTLALRTFADPTRKNVLKYFSLAFGVWLILFAVGISFDEKAGMPTNADLRIASNQNIDAVASLARSNGLNVEGGRYHSSIEKKSCTKLYKDSYKCNVSVVTYKGQHRDTFILVQKTATGWQSCEDYSTPTQMQRILPPCQ